MGTQPFFCWGIDLIVKPNVNNVELTYLLVIKVFHLVKLVDVSSEGVSSSNNNKKVILGIRVINLVDFSLFGWVEVTTDPKGKGYERTGIPTALLMVLKTGNQV